MARVLLMLGFLGSGLFGMLILALANGAIHQIAGFVLLLLAGVLFSGLAIVEAIRDLKNELKRQK